VYFGCLVMCAYIYMGGFVLRVCVFVCFVMLGFFVL